VVMHRDSYVDFSAILIVRVICCDSFVDFGTT